MNIIKVITRKEPINICSRLSRRNIGKNDIEKLSNNLMKHIVLQPGYITSKSYWEYNSTHNKLDDYKTDIIYTESLWQDVRYWNHWLNSDSRHMIHIKHNFIDQDIYDKNGYAINFKVDHTILQQRDTSKTFNV